MIWVNAREKAFSAPFLAFLAVFGLGALVEKVFDGSAAWALSRSEFWVMPLQVFVCGAMLWHFRRHFEIERRRGLGFGLLAGTVAFVVWIAPQAWLGFPPRVEGFDPYFFGKDGAACWLNVALRFLRLIVIVPLVEELFWRGFLLRILVREDFAAVPFGTFRWLSFWVVTAGFTFEHSRADWPAAFLTGVLFNLVAYRTRSLGACVAAHALTNLLLGVYILRTQQWGFW